VQLENLVAGDSIKVATDVNQLSGDVLDEPPVIWACYSGDGSGELGVRRVVMGRPGMHYLGLSTFSMMNGIFVLKLAEDDSGSLTSLRPGEVGITPYISLFEIHLYIWAPTGTKSVTIYCEAEGDASANVRLCGQELRLSNSHATFSWTNKYDGGH
jgi:hypothetical protein